MGWQGKDPSTDFRYEIILSPELSLGPSSQIVLAFTRTFSL